MNGSLGNWLGEMKQTTRRQYEFRWRYWCDWLRKKGIMPLITDEEIADRIKMEWKKTEDRDEFLKIWGSWITQYYRDLIKEGKSINTARARIIGPRSFFASQCNEVKIKRGAIAKPSEARAEHVFSQKDLQRMFQCADARGRAILTLGVSLGWGISDFLGLKREFISKLIKRAEEEGEDFIRFFVARKKTEEKGVKFMGILNPEAIESLKAWLRINKDSEYLFPSNHHKTKHITERGLNEALKKMVEDAGIVTIGKVRFHLLRKYLMSSLSRFGLNEWEVKTVVGKAIPTTDSTYLQRLRDDAFEKYKKAWPEFRISEIATSNHERLMQLSGQMEKLGKFIDLLVWLVEEKLKEKGVLTDDLKSLKSSDFDRWIVEVKELLS